MIPPKQAPPLARLLEQAAQAVQGVRAGQSLSALLPQVPPELRPGVQALAFTALRRMGATQRVREALAPKRPVPAVEALLLTALALLWPDDAPAYAEHTVVDQAVAAMRQRVPAAAGFVNAVLRRFVRERAACVAGAVRDPVGAWNHPLWWIERLRQDWPQHWQALLDQANRHPPMTLRVNARLGSGASYLQRLAEQGLAATLVDEPLLGGQAIVLHQPCSVQRLPGFAEGAVSVQDTAAQLAAPLLIGNGLAPGARVLDGCAAPGGKTAHLLERAELEVTALDVEPQRLARVQDNLRRLHLESRARLVAGDARRPQVWWDGRLFDAILLDAPCTASGIVRRHPDVRWLRRPEDVATLARTQAELLAALWPLLRPGGRLLYATCSIFKAEGQQQIDAFLQRPGSTTAHWLAHSPGHLLGLADNSTATAEVRAQAPGAPVAPNPGAGDGFFYALLEKH